MRTKTKTTMEGEVWRSKDKRKDDFGEEQGAER